MENLIFNTLFINAILISYFSGKDYLLHKIFNARHFKISHTFTILIGIASYVLGLISLTNFDDMQQLTSVAGAIKLPPFAVLFMMADAVSSGFVIWVMLMQGGLPRNQASSNYKIFEILRIIAIYPVFILLVNLIWIKQTDKIGIFSVNCLKAQLAIDFANYYFTNGQYPTTLQEFTTITINPINNAEILYELKLGKRPYISDTYNNDLTSTKVLMTEHYVNTNRQSEFYSTFYIQNEGTCEGQLKIP